MDGMKPGESNGRAPDQAATIQQAYKHAGQLHPLARLEIIQQLRARRKEFTKKGGTK